MIYIIQILSLLFAFRIGVHDAVAINGFIRCGSKPKEQIRFHSSNWQLKAIVCLALSLFFYPHWQPMMAAFILCGLIVWIVFDPIVARYRMNKQAWYYLTTGNIVDRILLHIFGKKAGVYKTVICLFLVLLFNLFHNKIFQS